jgi:hypothetical protein
MACGSRKYVDQTVSAINPKKTSRTHYRSGIGLAKTHQFLAANDKTKLTPDVLSRPKTFLCETFYVAARNSDRTIQARFGSVGYRCKRRTRYIVSMPSRSWRLDQSHH